jgi:hypothetical protein
MIRVEGYTNLYRDEKTGAIVNCDTMAYNTYVSSLNVKDSQKREIQENKFQSFKNPAFVG